MIFYAAFIGASDTEPKRTEATGKKVLATEPRAVAARYDRKAGRFVIELTNGIFASLASASPCAIEGVEPVQNGERPLAIRARGRGSETDFGIVRGDGSRAGLPSAC